MRIPTRCNLPFKINRLRILNKNEDDSFFILFFNPRAPRVALKYQITPSYIESWLN
jgi:hypothetical protein